MFLWKQDIFCFHIPHTYHLFAIRFLLHLTCFLSYFPVACLLIFSDQSDKQLSFNSPEIAKFTELRIKIGITTSKKHWKAMKRWFSLPRVLVFQMGVFQVGPQRRMKFLLCFLRDISDFPGSVGHGNPVALGTAHYHVHTDLLPLYLSIPFLNRIHLFLQVFGLFSPCPIIVPTIANSAIKKSSQVVKTSRENFIKVGPLRDRL